MSKQWVVGGGVGEQWRSPAHRVLSGHLCFLPVSPLHGYLPADLHPWRVWGASAMLTDVWFCFPFKAQHLALPSLLLLATVIRPVLASETWREVTVSLLGQDIEKSFSGLLLPGTWQMWRVLVSGRCSHKFKAARTAELQIILPRKMPRAHWTWQKAQNRSLLYGVSEV